MSSDITITRLPCYSANGTLSSSDLPCNPDGETSACCAPGYQCVNNLFCRRGTVTKPGSCTDENWNESGNTACPCPPRNNADDYLSNTIMCTMDSFLCMADGDENHQATDCSNLDIAQNPVIDYGNGLGVPTSTASADLEAYYSGLAISTASVPSRTSTTSSGTSDPTSSTTLTSAGATSTSSGTASTSGPSSGLSSSAKIGLGVGVGVGVPLLGLLAAIVVLLMRRRKPGRGEKVSYPSEKAMRPAPDTPAPEYRAVDEQQQQQSAELYTGPSTMELPGVRQPSELQASPAELDRGYGYGR